MAKSELISSVEKLAERVSRKVLKECRFFGDVGTWMKTFQDEIRAQKMRIEELEIRVRKLNDYGPTPLASARMSSHARHGQRDADSGIQPHSRLTKAQMRKIRTARGLSQAQFALLLGTSFFKYNKWERGKTVLPHEFEERIVDIREMKASDLRSCMQKVGIFQPSGKREASVKKTSMSALVKPPSANNAAAGMSCSAERGASKALCAEEIKSIRKALGITQREIAGRLSVKETRYKEWEQGRSRAPVSFIGKIRALAPCNSEQKAINTEGQHYGGGLPADRLKQLREKLGLSRREISEFLGIKKSRYCNWEYGLAKAPEKFIREIFNLADGKIKKNVPSPKTGTNPSGHETTAKTASYSSNPDSDSGLISPGEMKAIRSSFGISIGKMAILVGVHRNSYGNWECGWRQIAPEWSKKIRELGGLGTAQRKSLMRAAGITPFRAKLPSLGRKAKVKK